MVCARRMDRRPTSAAPVAIRGDQATCGKRPRQTAAALIQSDAALNLQIAGQESAIAEMPEHSEPSPEAAIVAMDKALAENDLIKMRNEKTRRKNAKRR